MADRCWRTPRNCLARNGEGFVSIIDAGCYDTPSPMMADSVSGSVTNIIQPTWGPPAFRSGDRSGPAEMFVEINDAQRRG
jgi:hypothetical protein